MDGFFKKVQNNVARAKQVAMVKIGQAEATIDQQFVQEEKNFKLQYDRMKKLVKSVQSFEEAIKESTTAEAASAQALYEQYESTQLLYPTAHAYNERVIQQLESIRNRFTNFLAEKFHQPISAYLTQYKTMDERIAERNRRLIDMDRYNLEYKQASEKLSSLEPIRLQLAKEKADKHTIEYKEINDELLRDIPLLIADRCDFIDGLFANLVDVKIDYYTEVAKIFKGFEAPLQNVNRNKIINRRPVITDPNQSAMNPKVSHPPPAQLAAQSNNPQNTNLKSVNSMQHNQPQHSQPQHSQPQPQQPMPSRPPPMPSASLIKAQALYAFQAQDHSELSFQPGEVITVTRQAGEWWEGEIGARRGLFPANYVRTL